MRDNDLNRRGRDGAMLSEGLELKARIAMLLGTGRVLRPLQDL